MSHSKRNTSLAFFTAHERDQLKSTWGSQATRLTRDSFLPFGSCQLCLLPAREPVACPSHGHLFCRECAVSNLLAQNKELKRLRKEAERRKVEEGEEDAIEEVERKARDLEEFERAQVGLDARTGRKAGERIVGRANGKVTVQQNIENGEKSAKRKFEVDEDELVRLVKEGEHKSKRRPSEQNGGNDELPAFWLPSKIPDNQKSDPKAIKQQPTCPAAASNQPHDFTLKTLISVHFGGDTEKGAADKSTLSCPSCNKVLSNATKAILGKPCGHVLCKPCSDKFQKPAEADLKTEKQDVTVLCFVCSEDVTSGRKKRVGKKKGKDGEEREKEKGEYIESGLVELSSEGTGFAGGGKNMVKREGVAFQC